MALGKCQKVLVVCDHPSFIGIIRSIHMDCGVGTILPGKQKGDIQAGSGGMGASPGLLHTVMMRSVVPTQAEPKLANMRESLSTL